MKVGAAIREILLADNTISSLLKQVSPLVMGQEIELPYCVYQVTDATPSKRLNGTALIDTVSVDLTVFSKTYLQAHEILDQVRLVLDNYCGTAAGVKLLKCEYEGSADAFNTPALIYGHTINFTLKVSVDVDGGLKLLSTHLNAIGQASINLVVSQYLEASFSATADAQLATTIAKRLSTQIGAIATAACSLNLGADLAAIFTAQGQATLAATIKKQIAATINTTGAASLESTIAKQFAATISAAGSASAEITVTESFETEYIAILDFATLQGYTLPSPAQQIVENARMKYLKDEGILNKLDRLHCFQTDGDSDFAVINWCDPILTKSVVKNGSPTFTPNNGFNMTSGGSVQLQFDSSDLGLNYSIDNGVLGYYEHEKIAVSTHKSFRVASTSIMSIENKVGTRMDIYYGGRGEWIKSGMPSRYAGLISLSYRDNDTSVYYLQYNGSSISSYNGGSYTGGAVVNPYSQLQGHNYGFFVGDLTEAELLTLNNAYKNILI